MVEENNSFDINHKNNHFNEEADSDEDNNKLITSNIYDIFMDNTTSQLESQLLASKKKMVNAQKGRNELFDILRVKGKALDYIILILSNNKDLIKGEDIYIVESLLYLFKLSKHDKVMFESISKKYF